MWFLSLIWAILPVLCIQADNLFMDGCDSSLPEPHSMLPLHPMPQSSSRRRLRGSELVPLFPGYGTHYVYAYVGTPPQRQSLIIDTGSHFTAFPCASCKQCGKHTDPYFDPQMSSTATIPKCLKGPECQVSQSYTEGSSWHGYKVSDMVWIGGEQATIVPDAQLYSLNLTFACQTDETGLFRTQLADGIMGMSAGEDTLPNMLRNQKVTDTKIFALCYRVGGGILTLGGVNQKIHAKPTKGAIRTAPILQYATMDIRSGGWYGVKVRGLRLVDPRTEVTVNVSTPTAIDNAFNPAPRGTIIDSGTTDTYLPAALASAFQAAFKKIAGIPFSSGNVGLTSEQMAALPNIVFDLEASLFPGVRGVNVPKPNGTITTHHRHARRRLQQQRPPPAEAPPSAALTTQVVTVSMPMSTYVDGVGDDKYMFRVYLTEKSGAVLGANWMADKNVIFDTDGRRLGLAKSTCNYEEFGPIATVTPTAQPTAKDGTAAVPAACDKSVYVPYTQCSARCNRNETAYTIEGVQDFISQCGLSSGGGDIKTVPCYENCTYLDAVRGDPSCPDTPWSECTHSCIMSRHTVKLANEPLYKKDGSCNYKSDTNMCYTGRCPRNDGDYLLYIDVRIRMDPEDWNYVHSETCIAALGNMFINTKVVKQTSIELLHSAVVAIGTGSRSGATTKLHFQMRLKAGDFKDEIALTTTAQAIVTRFRSADFGRQFVTALDTAGKVLDKDQIRRFGWLYPQDIEVLSAVALPIGGVRDPTAKEQIDKGAGSGVIYFGNGVSTTYVDLFLIGTAIAVLLVLILVLLLHCRLRTEYELLAKDKSSLARSSEALRRLWGKFADVTGARNKAKSGATNLSQQQAAAEDRLSRSGLMSSIEEEEDGGL